MPSIATERNGSLSSNEEMLAGNPGRSAAVTPRKRSLRSTAVAGTDSVKRKSPRRAADSSPASPLKGAREDRVERVGRSPVKKSLCDLIGKENWNPRDVEHVRAVKEALHVSTTPFSVVCREEEQKRVLDFCKECVEQEKPGSLYVCGCPGTGKSLSMEKVKQHLVDWAKENSLQPPDVLTLNCTSLVSTSEIFSKIMGKIYPRKKAERSTSPLQHLQKFYSQQQQSSGMMLIIADEMDYLITKDRAVLHDLFMLTTFPFSRCILIGVANAIDLADRFLPRLQSLNCKPSVITFRAYSKDQILRILQERVKTLPFTVFHPLALELCARKVAAASGDMRKALSVCRSAIEILEAELGDLESFFNVNAPENGSPVEDKVPCGLPKPIENTVVRIDHMANALSKSYKSPVVDTIQSLPQHQQIILCSAVKFFRGGKKDTTVAELNRSYLEVCKSTMVPAVGILEFLSMCRVLSDQGLLKLGLSRDDKLKRVTLKVDEADITFALQDIRFFRNCLK